MAPRPEGLEAHLAVLIASSQPGSLAPSPACGATAPTKSGDSN
jgi:hypothetical protein